MTFMSSCKEDLQYRMADLLQQLAQSEEERKKLEKTCNMLIRAFKEEEKLHYRALENKYEKFVEDCKVRRRRNDMILRSIHRVEDRAKALHTKTERLKILKNRYINYLKPLEFKKNEPPHTPEKITPSISLKSTLIDKDTSKSVHWKTPSVADYLIYPQVRSSSAANISKYLRYEGYDESNKYLPSDTYYHPLTRVSTTPDHVTRPRDVSLDDYKLKEKKRSDIPLNEKQSVLSPNKQDEIFQRGDSRAHETLNSEELSMFSKTSEPQNVVVNKENQREINKENDALKPERDSMQVAKQKSIIKHQESIEKLKTALSLEEDFGDTKDNLENDSNQPIIEKDEIENNEKHLKIDADVKAFIKNFKKDLNYTNLVTTAEAVEDNINSIVEEMEADKELPKGLDGIDYENETYPPSYYEQPVRQNNYSSIASNVILEEDEQEIDQQEIMETPTTPLIDRKLESPLHNFKDKENSDSSHSPSSSDRSKSKSIARSPIKASDSGGQDPGVTKFETEGSDKVASSNSLSDKYPELGKSQPTAVEMTKTNALKHLLESDSESFQIEHGDVASVNDDSDFDFSFNQN